ncbi:MAG: alpha/beta hydrolase [Antricoccus sp.]
MNWIPSTVTTASATAGELTFQMWHNGVVDTAPTVVALHGFPQSARSYRQVAAELATDGIRLIAYDQRGYSPGARPIGVDHYDDATLMHDVIDVLDALHLSQVHLVGHDWGSQIAWLTAEAFPERLTSLTAVSVPHPAAFGEAYRIDADQRSRSSYFALFRQEGTAETQLLANDAAKFREILDDLPAEQVDFYTDRMQQPGALTAALNWYRAMGSRSASLPSVTVPTTYVWSDHDRALGRTGAELCQKYVDADYQFITLPGITHWIPELAAGPLARAISDRVRSTESH